MTTITVANYSRKHGDIETISITDDVIDKIKDHIYVTQTGELVIGPIDGESVDKAYKEIVEINQHRLILETRENRIKYLKEYLNVTPKEIDWTIYLKLCTRLTTW